MISSIGRKRIVADSDCTAAADGSSRWITNDQCTLVNDSRDEMVWRHEHDHGARLWVSFVHFRSLQSANFDPSKAISMKLSRRSPKRG